MDLPFKQIDVFTNKPFKGNPVAVVFDADELNEGQMQRIANWTNLSETVFIQTSSKADYKLRIFTPTSELPFAGHPTIGSGFAAREHGIVERDKKLFTLECNAGIIQMFNEKNEIYAQVPEIKVFSTKINVSEFCNALCDGSFQDPLAIDAGPVWAVARLEHCTSLYNLNIDVEKTIQLSKKINVIGMTVYCIVPGEGVHVRTFAPLAKVNEDPVCGSGNAAVAEHIRITGKKEIFGNGYTAFQGKALGREGKIKVKYFEDRVIIGGSAATVVVGTITI